MTKEEKRVKSADYYANHRDEKLVSHAIYRESHRDEIRARDVVYYAANKDSILEKSVKEHAEFTEWLQILRTNNGCEDCKTHEGMLHHHHVDPATKLYSISNMCSFSLDRLEDELEKCVVLCASCHKKRHDEIRVLAA